MTIAVQHLGHAYGPVEALVGFNVDAAAGRITAVIGPNAAGKSTLLRCVIGALRPTSGQVLVDGTPAHHLRTRQLARRVAYVPQRSVVSAAFSVRDVVALGRYALPSARGRVERALEQMELLAIADRPYPELSIGQQQRATLARAVAQLAGDGHLILDEPTSAMDLEHVRLSLKLVRSLADGGATVLIAMHDLTLAAAVADDCWLLDRGRLAAAGPVAEVLDLERLRRTFKVGFDWVKRPGRAPVLLAEGLEK